MQNPANQPEHAPDTMSAAELDTAYTQAVALELQQTHTGPGARLRSWLGHELEMTEGLVERDTLPVVRLVRWAHSRPRLVHISAASAIGTVLVVGGVLWLLPHQIAFSFASAESCAFAPTILPGVYSADSQPNFELERPASVSIFGVGLFAPSVCARALSAPSPHATYVTRQYLNLLGWRVPVGVTIKTAAYVFAQTAASAVQALPLTAPLRFKLSAADAVFRYELMANSKGAPCIAQSTELVCSLTPLQLAYGTPYTLKLERDFLETPSGTVLTMPVTTITAVGITTSSIASGALVYDSPQQVALTTNKRVMALGRVTLQATVGGKSSPINATASFAGSLVTVRAAGPLPRRASIDLHIAQLTADDGSQLEQPYDLIFQTSGGPRVTGINIGSSGVSLRPRLNIYFDQTLQANQTSSGLATLAVNGSAVAASASISGSQLTLTLNADLPRCAALTIGMTSGVVSQYGFSGDSAWSYRSRTLCYTTYSIGMSVQGRPITAYQFGGGGNMVLYVAAMHGNESNTAGLLEKWIDTLDASPGSIPAGRTIVVIPRINPDGVAADTRENASRIDLNRNFPTNDWQTQVTEPWSNGKLTNEGGPSPLSEPESQAIASYIQAQHPRLVLTYHSHAGIVEPNDAGDSDQLGALYGAKTGYKVTPAYALGTTFDYSTTGAMEDWMRDKLGWPALLVELWTSSSVEYYTNLPAMWAMAQVQ